MHARRVLVDLAASPWRRLRRPRTTLLTRLTTVPPDDTLEAPDDRDELRAAWGSLPPRMRAVLALRLVDDLPEADAAAVLGLPAGALATEAARALDRLRRSVAEARDAERVVDLDADLTAVAAGGGAGRAHVDVPEPDVAEPDDGLEARLHDVLVPAAELLPPTPDPWSRFSRALARDRTRRGLGVAALVVVVAAVAGIAVLRLTGTAPPAAAPGRPPVTSQDLATWPTRGGLAGRADLLAGVRKGVGDEAVLSVPFLGEVAGRQLAMVVTRGPDDGTGRALWILTHDDAAAGWHGRSRELEATDPPVLSGAVPDAEGRDRLVVVTLSSGIDVAYSPLPDVDDRGLVTRRYTRVPLTDGIGSTEPGALSGHGVLRVQAAGAVSLRALGVRLDDPPDTGEVPVVGVPPKCSAHRYRDQVPSAVTNASTEITGSSGERRALGGRVLGCRTVRGIDLVLVAVRAQTGLGVQLLSETRTDRQGGSESTSSAWPVPRDRPDLPFVASLDLLEETPGPQGRSPMVCYAPGAATAQVVLDAAGPLSAPTRVDADGFALMSVRPAFEENAQAWLVLRDARGHETSRVRAFGLSNEDGWADDTDGPVTAPAHS